MAPLVPRLYVWGYNPECKITPVISMQDDWSDFTHGVVSPELAFPRWGWGPGLKVEGQCFVSSVSEMYG